jgi:Na+-translocating ferredoxin:NAD+ oxidoreductase RnfC subunit
MKRRLAIVLVSLLLVAGVGCAKKTTTSTPTAPPTNSLNSTDATLFETLAPIHAFVASMQQQNQAGTITLTANDKVLLNQLIADVNAADLLYQAWHAAGATGATTQINAAITKAQTDQTTLNAAIQAGR